MENNKLPYGTKSDLGITLQNSTVDVLNSKMREPCVYCNKQHLEYACDEQIKFLKWKN